MADPFPGSRLAGRGLLLPRERAWLCATFPAAVEFAVSPMGVTVQCSPTPTGSSAAEIPAFFCGVPLTVVVAPASPASNDDGHQDGQHRIEMDPLAPSDCLAGTLQPHDTAPQPGP
eukprot:EG_transcript_40102